MKLRFVDVPITERHVMLHLIRAVYLHSVGETWRISEGSLRFLAHEYHEKPSEYFDVIYSKWFRKPVSISSKPDAVALCEKVQGAVWYVEERLRSFIADSIEKDSVHANSLYQELYPMWLCEAGFESNADYLVCLSIFRKEPRPSVMTKDGPRYELWNATGLGIKEAPIEEGYLQIGDSFTGSFEDYGTAMKALHAKPDEVCYVSA